LSEAEWMKRRSEFIECGPPVDGCAEFGPHLFVRHVDQQRVWDAGAFRVWSLSELESAVDKLAQQDSGSDASECIFEIHIRTANDYRPVEVSHLQADCCRPENSEIGPTMFQVASNFNCCENSSFRTEIDRGDFVTYLMADSTQGPAAASGAGEASYMIGDAYAPLCIVPDQQTCTGVAAITRTHAAFYDPSLPADLWGQTSTRQVCWRSHGLLIRRRADVRVRALMLPSPRSHGLRVHRCVYTSPASVTPVTPTTVTPVTSVTPVTVTPNFDHRGSLKPPLTVTARDVHRRDSRDSAPARRRPGGAARGPPPGPAPARHQRQALRRPAAAAAARRRPLGRAARRRAAAAAAAAARRGADRAALRRECALCAAAGRVRAGAGPAAV
jgi:hypothetical protein